ncbi:MAG TPA: carbohydrate ABC transporter permease [Spirochaetia bacterium]|nr:carbohydrate ABC transporter permease [Spirochaetia bacterium]
MKWENRSRYVVVPLTIVILLVLLFPFFVMISTMLKSGQDVYTSPPFWIPTHIEWENFDKVWTQYRLGHYFLASLIIALGATALNAVLCIPAAYAVARLRFVGRKFALYLLLMIEMFSPVIVVIPLFKIVSQIGLLDSFLSLIIMDALFTVAFNTWMMNGYFKTIPKDIEEAALIDGCSRVQTMTRIMLPISVPGLVTVMIYAFIFAWNEFLFALSFITSKDKMPLTIALYNFVGRWTTQWQYLTMAAFLAIIPVLVLFYMIEKRLVAGLAGGAVKG